MRAEVGHAENTKATRILKRAAITVVALIFWLFVWYYFAKKTGNEWILPGPAQTLSRLWEMAKTSEFYRIMGLSFLRVFRGFLTGMIYGFALGTLSHYIYPFRALVSPMMSVIRATPVASFILAVYFWMTTDEIPTFISILMVLPIVWQNTVLGFEKKDPKLDEMAKAFRISPIRAFLRIDLPQILSYTLSAGKTALGLAWKAGVAAEVLASTRDSVGFEIYNSKYTVETIDLYAWTCAIILFSVLLEKLFSALFSGRRKKHADRA